MSDDLGTLVSAFVEERVDGPGLAEIDLWCEAVYSALFCVAFEVVTRLSSSRDSPEALESETNSIIAATCAAAVPWVNARLKEASSRVAGIPVSFDVGPEMQSRLVLYFNTAYDAMAERGYERAVARGHSCFAILAHVATELGSTGLTISPAQASAFVRSAFEADESLSREIARALEHHASNKRRAELNDLPAELVEAIEEVYRQADVFANARGPIAGGLMPRTGSVEKRLAAYEWAFHRLRMKLEIIPSALDALHGIDPQVQPRLYRYLVTLYLDVLKYDIDDASQKNGVRRFIERSWKRFKQRAVRRLGAR